MSTSYRSANSPTLAGHAESRVQVEETGVIDAPVDAVWGVLRDFAAGDRWLPGVTACEMEDGRDGTTIGAVRRLTLSDGHQTRERLIGLSDVGHTVELTIVESALPVRDYVATFRLSPISEGDRCLISWHAAFAADDAAIPAIAERLRKDVFRSGFEGLRRNF